ncbi:SGT1-plant-like protein [Medicago truncatula]|uniref:SGT1-plant-like protein n=1 Tax=Medicago truncatula TaxID=3880 RepID=A0A072URQ5_MEDTR|nr:SGT1-plant-like protein [Medicago truncatula]
MKIQFSGNILATSPEKKKRFSGEVGRVRMKIEFPPSSFTTMRSNDTVFYAIYPDSLTTTTPTTLQILQTISPFTTDYIWQHQPFTLSLSPFPQTLPPPTSLTSTATSATVTTSMANCSLSSSSSTSPATSLPFPSAFGTPMVSFSSLKPPFIFLVGLTLKTPTTVSSSVTAISISSPTAVMNMIKDYPDQAKKNMHTVRVRVPVSVAMVLKHEPCLISLAVEGFYDRDIDSMKFAAKMEKFLEKGREEELVCVCVKLSRAMYAQLVQQTFRAPKVYPELPSRDHREEYAEAELGLKIACGMEMMYQQRKRDGVEGKGSTWEAFKQSLEKSGYFQGLLPGSSEYQRLMQNAQEYYRNTSLYSKSSDLMNAPVRRIDEILALPYSVDEFNGQELPPSDDDSWLYNGEEELNSALMERQKEMELYDLKHKGKGKEKRGQDTGSNADEFDPSDLAKSMRAFVDMVSSFEGAEAPEDRNKEVNFDADQFLKDMESVMKRPGEADNSNIEEGSSSDLDLAVLPTLKVGLYLVLALDIPNISRLIAYWEYLLSRWDCTWCWR